MNAQTMSAAGIRLSYSLDCCVREIPSVQDVLYALRLTESQECYDFNVAHSATYISNVHLVAATLDVSSLSTAFGIRKIVAQAILELCPQEAKCVDCLYYRELLNLAGLPRPPHECRTCPHCLALTERSQKHSSGWDGDDDVYFHVPRG